MQGTGLESTDEGRQVLEYLLQCALKPDQSVYFEVAGSKYEYHGSMGLAPEWTRKPLDETSQRWVSACMLSRINFYGRKVLISLRTPNLTSSSLPPTQQHELDTYTLHEGGFFGNLFTDRPVAYSCAGSSRNLPTTPPALQARRCTETTRQTLADGRTLTLCGFIDTGTCPSSDKISINGREWKEIVHIYLDPDAGFAD